MAASAVVCALVLPSGTLASAAGRAEPSVALPAKEMTASDHPAV
jgi:hypothetical protein